MASKIKAVRPEDEEIEQPVVSVTPVNKEKCPECGFETKYLSRHINSKTCMRRSKRLEKESEAEPVKEPEPEPAEPVKEPEPVKVIQEPLPRVFVDKSAARRHIKIIQRR